MSFIKCCICQVKQDCTACFACTDITDMMYRNFQQIWRTDTQTISAMLPEPKFLILSTAVQLYSCTAVQLYSCTAVLKIRNFGSGSMAEIVCVSVRQICWKFLYIMSVMSVHAKQAVQSCLTWQIQHFINDIASDVIFCLRHLDR